MPFPREVDQSVSRSAYTSGRNQRPSSKPLTPTSRPRCGRREKRTLSLSLSPPSPSRSQLVVHPLLLCSIYRRINPDELTILNSHAREQVNDQASESAPAARVSITKPIDTSISRFPFIKRITFDVVFRELARTEESASYLVSRIMTDNRSLIFSMSLDFFFRVSKYSFQTLFRKKTIYRTSNLSYCQ